MENDLYQLHFTPLAYEDMDEILSYISNKLSNPQAAESLFEEIEKSIQRLMNPGRNSRDFSHRMDRTTLNTRPFGKIDAGSPTAS